MGEIARAERLMLQAGASWAVAAPASPPLRDHSTRERFVCSTAMLSTARQRSAGPAKCHIDPNNAPPMLIDGSRVLDAAQQLHTPTCLLERYSLLHPCLPKAQPTLPAQVQC